MLSAVETAFDGIAQTRKRIMIEWANEIWREVENSAILLEQEECDVVSILKEQEKLSEAILEYYVLNSAKKMLFSSNNRPLKEYKYDESGFGEALDYVLLGSSQLLFGPYIDDDTLFFKPKASTFHDRVTLAFMKSFKINNRLLS